MRFATGARFRSAVDDTQVVVIRASAALIKVTCGGHPLVPIEDEPQPGLTILPGHDGGTVLGKRYADTDSGLELLCTKAGPSALFLENHPLPIKAAKSLPASD